ncbi:MAG: hypothetical protein ACKVU4_14325 [Phycisphaerales bacterium]
MMIRWLCMVLISDALDADRPPPAWVARRMERSADLRRFAARTARLDRALAGAPPPIGEPPPFLGARVRAVIEGPRDQATLGAWGRLRLAAGVTLCAAALAGVFVAVSVLNPPGAGPVIPRGRPDAPNVGLGPIARFSPGAFAASGEQLVKNGAEIWWDEARASAGVFVRTVASRLPSPPTVPR